MIAAPPDDIHIGVIRRGKKDPQVVLHLDLDGVQFLANELPQRDGFTHEIQKAAAELLRRTEALEADR